MNMFRAWVLHRVWIPAVALVTVAVFVPRAMEATSKMSRISRAAGVHGWTTIADASEFGETRFRQIKRFAALHEPVQGRIVMVPLFVDGPDVETTPVTIRVTVGGVDTPPLVLQRRGWQTATYDLVELFGESRWRSRRAVTLSFGFTGLAEDVSLPIVGLGDVHWRGPNPR